MDYLLCCYASVHASKTERGGASKEELLNVGS